MSLLYITMILRVDADTKRIVFTLCLQESITRGDEDESLSTSNLESLSLIPNSSTTRAMGR